MQELDTAITLAIKYHSGQTDKMGLPYIFHPMNVMMRVHDDDANMLKIKRIVAILHDVAEDCKVNAMDLMREMRLLCPHLDIRDYFQITSALIILTHTKGVPYSGYIAAIPINKIALCVKIADMEHNMSPERMNALPIETQDYLNNKYKESYALLTSMLV